MDKTLVAVSGGIDSMVLLDLYRRSDLPIEVAHVDHNTRNGQSAEDAKFVKSYCEKYSIPHHATSLDYDVLAKGNFQQNARKARYAYFHEIRLQRNLDWIATAHHQDDRWETFLMHLNRKAGIHGLTSLRPQSSCIVRPLLICRRQDIEQYAKKYEVAYREDESNHRDDYLRNQIRHHVTPSLRSVMPDIVENAGQSITHLTAVQSLLDELIDRSQIIVAHRAYLAIDMTKVAAFDHAPALAYEILARYGFSPSDIADMRSATHTGSTFLSATHEGLYDRGHILIRERQDTPVINCQLLHQSMITLPDGRTVGYGIMGSCDIEIPLQESATSVRLRSVQPGDYYRPDHLQGKKKTLKKYMNDRKLNRYLREEVLVLEVDGAITMVILPE